MSLRRKLFPLLIFGTLLGCIAEERLSLSLPESSLPYDRGWQAALEATHLYYPRVAIEDKESGFFQTAWSENKVGLIIGAPVRRTRLIGRVLNRAPFRLQLTLEEEAFSMELGRWVAEAPDGKFLNEIAQNIRFRL